MRALFAVLLLSCATACGAESSASPRPHSAHDGKSEIEVPRTVITPQGAASIPELMLEADALAKAQRWGEAAAAYDRAHRLDTEDTLGTDALWGAADAYDQANNLEAALRRYETVSERESGTVRGRTSLVRASRLAVFLGRFEVGGQHAERLSKVLDQLSDFERIAVLSAKALGLLSRKEDQEASYFIEKARDVIESKQLDAAGRVPRDLAQLYYALGESRRIKAERISFQPTPPVPAFFDLLEQRCQLLLDAQSAYSDTTRAYDAHWSAMAGFRTVELYQKLHQDLFPIAPPPSADTERKQQLFEGAVRVRYGVLLSKAQGMAKHTLAMAERAGERSEWVERTRTALKAIDQSISDQDVALAKLPYSKADFEAYLVEREAKAASPAAKPSAPGSAPPRPTTPKPTAPAPTGSPGKPGTSRSGKP